MEINKIITIYRINVKSKKRSTYTYLFPAENFFGFAVTAGKSKQGIFPSLITRCFEIGFPFVASFDRKAVYFS